MYKSWQQSMFLAVMLSLLLVLAVPAFAQDGGEGEIAEATIQISCTNAAGEEVNSGLGTITPGDPTLLLTDKASAEACAKLGAELFLSQLSPEALAELGVGAGSGDEAPSGNPLAGALPAVTDDSANAAGASGVVSASNTPGAAVGPAPNFAQDCNERGQSNQQIIASTENAIRINAFLPAGNYKAVAIPILSQTFNPVLFVNVNDGDPGGTCSISANSATAYALDFSRLPVSRQFYGHSSGGVLEFTVPAGTEPLTQVEILVGGETDDTGLAQGDFMLFIEGGILTPTSGEHIYNVSVTESMLTSNVSLGTVVVGVNDFLDPNLQAGWYSDPSNFNVLFACEDAGSNDCQSDALGNLEDSSIIEAQGRTIRGDERDAAIVIQPSAYLRAGLQDVSFVVSQVNGDPLREEYVIVFYGGVN